MITTSQIKWHVYPSVSVIGGYQRAERIIATAAKLCYSKHDPDDIYNSLNTDKSISDFINRLDNYGHQSPFEHASFTYMVTGASRSLLAQITRHRLASFSVQSQRYNTFDDCEFVVPVNVANEPYTLNSFLLAAANDLEAYQDLWNELMTNQIWGYVCEEPPDTTNTEYLEAAKKICKLCGDASECKVDHSIHAEVRELAELAYTDNKPSFKKAITAMEKKANEDARCLLPNAASCNFVMTMNIRELLHFFQLRCCNRAQDEIRHLAWDMLKHTYEYAPHIMSKAGPSCICEGHCTEGAMSCGNPYPTSYVQELVTPKIITKEIFL